MAFNARSFARPFARSFASSFAGYHQSSGGPAPWAPPVTPLIWFDARPSSGQLFADTAGTTPAEVDGAVQRVNCAGSLGVVLTQATNPPTLRFSGGFYFLEWNGSTTRGLTGAADFSAHGEITAMAALRKVDDSVSARLAFRHNTTAANGFRMEGQHSGGSSFRAASGAGTQRIIGITGFASPVSAVVEMHARQQSTSLVRIRVNGGSWAELTTEQGANTNYQNSTFAIGSATDGTTSLWSGPIHQLFVLPSHPSAENLTIFREFCASMNGVSL